MRVENLDSRIEIEKIHWLSMKLLPGRDTKYILDGHEMGHQREVERIEKLLDIELVFHPNEGRSSSPRQIQLNCFEISRNPVQKRKTKDESDFSSLFLF